MCDKINEEGLKKAEKEVNDFTSSHEITDIKISTCCNSFGSAILYCVIYKEKQEVIIMEEFYNKLKNDVHNVSYWDPKKAGVANG